MDKKLLNGMGRVLAVVLPKAEAAAGCAPDPAYQYRCDAYGHRYRRRCYTTPSCNFTCDPWVHVGEC